MRKQLQTRGIIIGSALAIFGCQFSPSQTSSTSSQTTLEYNDWCSTWSLSCPAQDSSSHSMSAGDWQAMVSLTKAFLKGPSEFEVNKSDLENPSFKQAIFHLGYSKVFNNVFGKLNNAHWKSLSIKGDGSIRINFAEETQTTGKSGLKFLLGKEVKLTLAENDSIGVSGIQIADETGDKNTQLKSVLFNRDGSMSWQAQAFSVTKAPAAFLRNEFEEELTHSQIQAPGEQNFIQAIGPLKAWLDARPRKLSFGTQFFQVLKSNSQHFAKTNNEKTFLSNITYFSFGSTGNEIARLRLGNGVKCELRGDTDVDLDLTDVRLVKVDASRPGNVDLHLTGLEALGYGTFMGVTLKQKFKIEKISVSSSSMTVYNTPKGNVTTPLTGGNGTTNCMAK